MTPFHGEDASAADGDDNDDNHSHDDDEKDDLKVCGMIIRLKVLVEHYFQVSTRNS